MKINTKIVLIFFELLPFANFDRKLDITKILTARGFKVGQLIEGNEWITGEI